MSAFSGLFATLAQPFLLDRLGEPATRYPLGAADDAGDPIDGIFEELEPQPEIRSRDDVIRRARLQIAATETASVKDAWLVRGEVWQVLSLEQSPGSLTTVHIIRHDKQATRRTGDRIL